MRECTERGFRNLQTVCKDCGRVTCTKTIPMILSEKDVSFIKYFLDNYKNSFKKGHLHDANHDAVAITLYLDGLFEDGNPNI